MRRGVWYDDVDDEEEEEVDGYTMALSMILPVQVINSCDTSSLLR